MQVSLAPAAQRDLAIIRAHIGIDRPKAAARMVMRLLNAAEDLGLFPQRGRLGRAPGTRELATVAPYIIVYRVFEDRVEVTGIFHGAQDR